MARSRGSRKFTTELIWYLGNLLSPMIFTNITYQILWKAQL